jgi:hypothetical protein
MKRTVVLSLSLLAGSPGFAQPGPAQELSDIETEITKEQRRLELLKARAARHAFEGTGSASVPQIVAVYGTGERARALLDLGGAGLREVGPGDLLGAHMVVSVVDAHRGVQVRMGSGKTVSTIHLTMKAPPQASAASAAGAPGPVAMPPGLSMGQGMPMVPPLMPAPQR